MIAETFFELVRDPGHWYFELLLIALFDGLIGALLWPRFKAWRKHHRDEEEEHKRDDALIAELRQRVWQLEHDRDAKLMAEGYKAYADDDLAIAEEMYCNFGSDWAEEATWD